MQLFSCFHSNDPADLSVNISCQNIHLPDLHPLFIQKKKVQHLSSYQRKRKILHRTGVYVQLLLFPHCLPHTWDIKFHTCKHINKSRKFVFISEDTIISLLGLNPAQQRHCQREACILCQPWCSCCSLPPQPFQSQHCYLSPAHAGTFAPPPHPPSPSSAQLDTRLYAGYLWSQGKFFKAYTVPPSWRWFCLLQHLPTLGRVFNSSPTFSSTEG